MANVMAMIRGSRIGGPRIEGPGHPFTRLRIRGARIRAQRIRLRLNFIGDLAYGYGFGYATDLGGGGIGGHGFAAPRIWDPVSKLWGARIGPSNYVFCCLLPQGLHKYGCIYVWA